MHTGNSFLINNSRTGLPVEIDAMCDSQITCFKKIWMGNININDIICLKNRLDNSEMVHVSKTCSV